MLARGSGLKKHSGVTRVEPMVTPLVDVCSLAKDNHQVGLVPKWHLTTFLKMSGKVVEDIRSQDAT